MANHVFDGQAPSTPPPVSKSLGPLTQLLTMVKPYQRRFWLASVALFVSSGLGLVYPYAARQAVDDALAHKSMTDLNKLASLLI